MKVLVGFILVSTFPSIILFDLNIKYENYNPKILYENFPGYGKTWMYFPDGNGIPQIAYLNLTKLVRNILTVNENDITFHLYTRLNKENNQFLIIDNNETLSNSNFDSNRPTKFFTHGWTSSQNSDTSQALKNNYLEMEDANVILVDWSKIASDIIYPIPAIKTKQVGEHVARMVDFLADNGLDVNKVHMIGHSLGAHVTGSAGSSIKKGKIARITGLDPALPGFEIISPIENRLDKSDAQFVDVIHTCGGVLGYFSDIGHADFYPNGGVPSQPGCFGLPQIIEGCSHGRSWQYYAESIKFRNAFLADKCNSWDSFRQGNCNDSIKVPMGLSTPSTVRGVYYLVTDHSPPFAREIDVAKIIDSSIGDLKKIVKLF